jgi:hypothetical protein
MNSGFCCSAYKICAFLGFYAVVECHLRFSGILRSCRMSVTHYHSTLCKIPEGRRSHVKCIYTGIFADEAFLLSVVGK